MSTKIRRNGDITVNSQILKGALKKVVQNSGKFPPVSIIVTPIDKSPTFSLERFISYSFNTSITIPVDSFSFTFVAPDDPKPFYERVKEGDIITLFGNGVQLATGLIDTVEIETEASSGERVTINGRDLMGQMEDQDAININSGPIYSNKTTVFAAAGKLVETTRIQHIKVGKYTVPLFGTEVGESKISALQRLIESLNLIAWMLPNGSLKIDKPNFAQAVSGKFAVSKEKRDSNVLSIRVIYAAAMVPNVYLPVWSGQEEIQFRVAKEQEILNPLAGPKRLRELGHFLPKASVIGTPAGGSVADNALVSTIVNSAPGTWAKQHSLREMARRNKEALIVEVVVPGHYNTDGSPYGTDKTYIIDYDRGSIKNKKMYLFQSVYQGSEETGQRTSLYFCELNTIVSNNKAQV